MHSYTEVQVGLKLWFFFLRKLRVLEFVFRACEINLLYLFNLFFETMRDQNAKSSKKKKRKWKTSRGLLVSVTGVWRGVGERANIGIAAMRLQMLAVLFCARQEGVLVWVGTFRKLILVHLLFASAEIERAGVPSPGFWFCNSYSSMWSSWKMLLPSKYARFIRPYVFQTSLSLLLQTPWP